MSKKEKRASINIFHKQFSPSSRHKLYADMIPAIEIEGSSRDEDIAHIEHCISLSRENWKFLTASIQFDFHK